MRKFLCLDFCAPKSTTSTKKNYSRPECKMFHSKKMFNALQLQFEITKHWNNDIKLHRKCKETKISFQNEYTIINPEKYFIISYCLFCSLLPDLHEDDHIKKFVSVLWDIFDENVSRLAGNVWLGRSYVI